MCPATTYLMRLYVSLILPWLPLINARRTPRLFQILCRVFIRDLNAWATWHTRSYLTIATNIRVSIWIVTYGSACHILFAGCGWIENCSDWSLIFCLRSMRKDRSNGARAVNYHVGTTAYRDWNDAWREVGFGTNTKTTGMEFNRIMPR